MPLLFSSAGDEHRVRTWLQEEKPIFPLRVRRRDVVKVAVMNVKREWLAVGMLRSDGFLFLFTWFPAMKRNTHAGQRFAVQGKPATYGCVGGNLPNPPRGEES